MVSSCVLPVHTTSAYTYSCGHLMSHSATLYDADDTSQKLLFNMLLAALKDSLTEPAALL